jgi:hypothetical protein
MLEQLAEDIQVYLNSLPSEKWGSGDDLIPGDKLPIENALDADEVIRCTTRKIFIMPVKPDYQLESSNKRGAIVQNLTVEYTVSAVIIIPFETIQKGDVASWSEVKRVLKLREVLDINIIKGNFGLNLNRVDAGEPVEVELNKRVYLTNTDFIYEAVKCAS